MFDFLFIIQTNATLFILLSRNLNGISPANLLYLKKCINGITYKIANSVNIATINGLRASH